MRSTSIAFLAGFILTLATTAPASAASVLVTLNTSGLPAGNYLFDFQFINGDATTGNNTATVSGFTSTNLTLGALSLFGTASGTSLVSGVTLIDGPMTEVDQAFTATAAAANVSFTLNYSENYLAPGPGDALTFAITDTSLNSTRSSGNGAELEVDITGPNSPVSVFPADAAFGGFEPGTAAVTSSVPEPATAALLGGSLFFIGILFTRRQRNRRQSSNRLLTQ